MTESADTPKCRELVQVNCAYASTCGNDLPCPDHPAVETPTYGKVTCTTCGAVERLTPTRATFDHPAGRNCSDGPDADICDCHMTLGMYGERAVETPTCGLCDQPESLHVETPTEPMTSETSEAYIDIVFDGPPAPESGRFVEVESPRGVGVKVGVWHDRGDGYWALRLMTDRRHRELMTQLANQYREERDRLQSALTAAEKERDDCLDRINKVQPVLSNLESDKTELQSSLHAAEEKIAALERDRAALLGGGLLAPPDPKI